MFIILEAHLSPKQISIMMAARTICPVIFVNKMSIESIPAARNKTIKAAGQSPIIKTANRQDDVSESSFLRSRNHS